MTRTERRADALSKGDRVEINGVVWTVTKVKVKGKTVKLGVESRRGSFERLVKAKTTYTVVQERAGDRGRNAPIGDGRSSGSSTQGRARPVGGTQSAQAGPLLNASGAMTRWAEPREAESRDIEPPPKARRSDPWEHVTPADRVVIEELGAKLIGVEVEGGKLIVPPVTDSTIFGHLLTMHGRRFDGATMAEAKAWAREHDAGGAKTADQVLGILDFEKAYHLHETLHGDLTAMERPHWHRRKAPR